MPKSPKDTKEKVSTPRKPKEAWTAEQDLALFNCLYKRVDKPDWKSIAVVVGRDATACLNRDQRYFKKNLEAPMTIVNKAGPPSAPATTRPATKKVQKDVKSKFEPPANERTASAQASGADVTMETGARQ